MAVLTTAERDEVFRSFMRVVRDPCTYLKDAARNAVDDVDNWCESAAGAIPSTSFNGALNLPFRSTASSSQKATMLALVAWKRAGRPLPEAV